MKQRMLEKQTEWAVSCDSAVEKQPLITGSPGSANESSIEQISQKRKQRGFSLTEIIIVVLVILVVGAISIPNMVKAWYDSQLRTCAFELSDLIQQARMYATKQNKTVTVRFQVTSGVTQAYIDVNNSGSWDPNANPANLSSIWDGNLRWLREPRGQRR